MSSLTQTREMEFFIGKPPESVRAWWTQFPDEYHASNPKEEPFRMVTLQRFPGGRLLLTYWHNDNDPPIERHEILVLRGDGSWTVEETDSPRFHFYNEYHVRAENGRTRLHIRQTITPKDPSYANRIPDVMKAMSEVLKEAAEICEHDAP